MSLTHPGEARPTYAQYRSEPEDMPHSCWYEIACSCNDCGETGCRDCLKLTKIWDSKFEDYVELCAECI